MSVSISKCVNWGYGKGDSMACDYSDLYFIWTL